MLELLNPVDRKMVETDILDNLLFRLQAEDRRVTLNNLKDLDEEPESIELKAPAV